MKSLKNSKNSKRNKLHSKKTKKVKKVKNIKRGGGKGLGSLSLGLNYASSNVKLLQKATQPFTRAAKATKAAATQRRVASGMPARP